MSLYPSMSHRFAALSLFITSNFCFRILKSMKFVNWQLHLKFRSHFLYSLLAKFQFSIIPNWFFSPFANLFPKFVFFLLSLTRQKKHDTQKNQVITMAGSVRIKTCDLDLMQEPQVNLLSENAKLSLLTHHNSSFFFFSPNNREPSIISTHSYEIKPKIRREKFFIAFFFPRSPYFCTTKEIFPKFYLFVCETIENDPFYFWYWSLFMNFFMYLNQISPNKRWKTKRRSRTN